MNDVNSAIKFHERHLELATDGELAAVYMARTLPYSGPNRCPRHETQPLTLTSSNPNSAVKPHSPNSNPEPNLRRGSVGGERGGKGANQSVQKGSGHEGGGE